MAMMAAARAAKDAAKAVQAAQQRPAFTDITNRGVLPEPTAAPPPAPPAADAAPASEATTKLSPLPPQALPPAPCTEKAAPMRVASIRRLPTPARSAAISATAVPTVAAAPHETSPTAAVAKASKSGRLPLSVLYKNYGLREMQHMLQREFQDVPEPDYMRGQPELSVPMRKILNDWLTDINKKFDHRKESLFLTVQVLDRYLCKQKVSKSHLQLLGSACVLLATKFEEVTPPEVKDLLHSTDGLYTAEELHHMECSILRTLGWSMATPTAAHFLRHILAADRKAALLAMGRPSEEDGDATPREWEDDNFSPVASGMPDPMHPENGESASRQIDTPTEQLAWCLLDLSLLEIKMLRYRASQVAAAALMLSNQLLGVSPAWPSTLAQLTSCDEESLEECRELLLKMLWTAPNSPLSGLRKRYVQIEALGVTRDAVEKCCRV